MPYLTSVVTVFAVDKVAEMDGQQSLDDPSATPQPTAAFKFVSSKWESVDQSLLEAQGLPAFTHKYAPRAYFVRN